MILCSYKGIAEIDGTEDHGGLRPVGYQTVVCPLCDFICNNEEEFCAHVQEAHQEAKLGIITAVGAVPAAIEIPWLL